MNRRIFLGVCSGLLGLFGPVRRLFGGKTKPIRPIVSTPLSSPNPYLRLPEECYRRIGETLKEYRSGPRLFHDELIWVRKVEDEEESRLLGMSTLAPYDFEGAEETVRPVVGRRADEGSGQSYFPDVPEAHNTGSAWFATKPHGELR